MQYIAIFFTHSGAIKYSGYLESLGIEHEVLPVPRKLSSNCGIGVKFCYNHSIEKIINDDIEKMFKTQNGEYVLSYCSD